MRHENRVAWTEGMFLRVQHFQQSDRWTERLVRSVARSLTPYPWGILEIGLDRSALAIGQFALSGLRGMLPDGTLFDAPEDTDLPAALELDESVKNAVIYLALPARQPGKADMAQTGTSAVNSVRLVASPYEAPDANVETDFLAPIDVGRLNLKLLKTGDDLAGYELLGLARVVEVRSDKAVLLDPDFIPASLNCTASSRLHELMTELLGIVRHRAEAIAERIGDPTIRGTAEVGDYFLLQILNRADPLLKHALSNATRLHPIQFYEQCIQLAGELATFTMESKRATDFPAYRHDDLKATFGAVFEDLRTSLSSVLAQSAVAIELVERRHGVRVGTINDRSLLRDAGFVLAVRADMSAEDVRRTLPARIKVGPVERIAELVNVALPGIPVRPLPVLPRQLPYRAGTIYFELDTKTPLWKQLETSGAIALHLAGDFPGLELEMWALRE
ncbi:type VI secretion system baseplate subunit TssK [Agrobacterium vitis]|uniref:Type VI secretion system baseplate subunit TssK n=1 Tax=Agrobacterium vitis TaxID=373 RepID=A0A368NYN2_AGRVI|nr:type VI secretion system baseplate subunit TssK [Agrobacterium vitis]KAA3511354.1 type VI secretion system baseplate subunit TssK [Agrobacterium vitis]KAA3527825.1 type VI secretion system baseplate subunit TssK [Agrobacterium vitis]MCF1478354.1 type VI secretion system baseplate subunit TssK [Agrobacterium vitis]MUZ96515.1 type VI secretion system baseplate subunit TssK [Agrobacterium vitis]MVA28632.1 type VI secretion system baseplate subunit TssK [Agrobacterium vitis]